MGNEGWEMGSGESGEFLDSSFPAPHFPFATLARPVEVRGVGLHSGAEVTARLLPRQETGWVFARGDLPGVPEVSAVLENVARTTHATTLQEGAASVATTEHLLAALWARGVTNCRIELDGPEVPILDGSALPWCRLLREAGLEILPGERPIWQLTEPIWVEDGGANVLGLPHPEFRLSVGVDFSHRFAGPQTVDLGVNFATLEAELAPARTFTLENWLAPLREQGLIRGGSLENAVVVGKEGLSSPWRMADELARHKALDVVGDLALLFGRDGGVFRGHIIALRAGHGPHRAWMIECRRRGALTRCIEKSALRKLGEPA